VLVHRLSQKHTQAPFKKPKGQVQVVSFHPSKPFLFVCTQSQIRVYNLIRQSLTKKLKSEVRLISSIAVHSDGDNFLIGSYDKRVCWFDMDFDNKPLYRYKFHYRAVRAVKYHKKYPLFASCSDDATVHLFHHQIFPGSFQEPTIVPLKILKGHKVVNDLGILHIEFHPTQPWIFTCGADGDIILFT
jgi:ribosome biogenesis protein ERB1